MQEDIERRTVAVSITATKLTAKVLAKALASIARKIQKEHRKARMPEVERPGRLQQNFGRTDSL